MKLRETIQLTLVTLLALTGWGGFHSPATGADAPLTFEEHVRPLLKARCFSCHGEGDEAEGALDVRLVRLISAGGDSGTAIVPGKRGESLLYTRMRDGEMPPEGTPGLTPSQIEVIGRWIDEGAKTRRPEPAEVSASLITEEDRAFWSFQPLQKSSPPVVSPALADRVAGRIDRFILGPLEKGGIEPAPSADARTLLRRVSIVLTGLPPNADEIAGFRENFSPQRYEAEVDRLLASPHFGERWGRMWLDLARYVDQVPNYGTNAAHAWRYRDWVVRSFNEDRPYDEFVRLQLAADLIPGTDPEDLAALGLLGLSPSYWKELKLAPDVIKTTVADEWDERVDMLSRTFLGLSVACARCHHHKFDPITIEDYYALAGVVANSQIVDRPLLPPDRAEEVLKARAEVARLEAQLKALKKESPPEEAARLKERIEEIRKQTADYDAPTAHMVEDASLEVAAEGEDATKLVVHRDEMRDLPVFRRGNPSDPGPVVPRRFLTVLCSAEALPFREGSGRRELAEALFREGQALTARVFVNRLWAQVFGKWLVKTPSDFGQQGDRPTHPELLDDLAARFIAGNWSVKRLLREMVLSKTFQQTSRGTPTSREKDPTGQLLSRMPRRKLEVEAWRDGLLAVTGRLDDRLYGPAEEIDRQVPLRPFPFRRTLYGKVVREDLHVMLRLFDFPESAAHSPCREPTTTPLQQLYVLNGPLLKQVASTFVADLAADRTADPAKEPSTDDFVRQCYERLFQRAPTPYEAERGRAFFETPSGGAAERRLTEEAYVHVLLGLNEMMFLD